MGYRVIVFTDEVDSPAGQVAHETIRGDYLDPNLVRQFAERVDVITLEFENIAIEAVARAAEVTLVRPGVQVLAVAQNRLKEKRTLQDAGFRVTPFFEIRTVDDVELAAIALGWPMVLKTVQWGYDGKGQRKIANAAEALNAIELLGPESLIAEKWIPYMAEVSVIVARTAIGETAVFPMFTNVHSNHILDVTSCPAEPSLHGVARGAEKIALDVANSLQLEGVLCVEFFVCDGEIILINEIAPRTHNSGHLTMEACRTSQFEQQVRAICNLPLGDTSLIQPAAMVNLLGDVWGDGSPHFERALLSPATYLHLYGKEGARPGRKMGHLTKLSTSAAVAAKEAISLREAIRCTEARLF